jgi:hypothetical protein
LEALPDLRILGEGLILKKTEVAQIRKSWVLPFVLGQPPKGFTIEREEMNESITDVTTTTFVVRLVGFIETKLGIAR